MFEGDSCYPISPMNQEDIECECDNDEDREKTAFSSND